MNDEQTISRALREAREQLQQVEWRIQMSRASGNEDNAERWESQHGRPLRERIEVYEAQLAVWRGEQPPGAVLDVHRKHAGYTSEGGDDGR